MLARPFISDSFTHLENELREKHPWIGNRPVCIPDGWTGVLDDACEEMEAMFYPTPAESAVEYFFATVRETKLRLFVRLRPEFRNEARSNDINSLINEVGTMSQHTCCICGCETYNGNLFSQNKGTMPDCGRHGKDETEASEPNTKEAPTASVTQLPETANPDEKTLPKEVDSPVSADAEANDIDNEEAPTSIQIYDIEAIRTLHNVAATRYRDRDDASKVKAMLSKLIKQGSDRRLKPMPESAAFLDQLQADFPNFTEVVDMLRGVHALTSPQEVQRIPPILLLGPPGVGKTMFAEALAKAMNSTFRVMRMENQQAGAGLVGSADFWSNSKPGMVFNVLTENDCGNPVIVVDEVDKAGRDQQYNPVNGLYSLLEPGSAQTFRDESFPDIPIDASMVTWVLTANYVRLIPEPILSRVRVFEIPNPDQEQSAQVAHRIYQSLLGESPSLTKRFDQSLSAEVTRLLAMLSPRKMRLAIQTAMGRAARASRRFLIAEDIDVEKSVAEKKIGFV